MRPGPVRRNSRSRSASVTGAACEANPVACPLDGASEGRQHLLLPLEIVLLRSAVSNPEVGGMGADPPERAVTEASAEEDLPLVVGQPIVLHRDQHLVADLDVPCSDASPRREDDVVLGRRESAPS